jgi:hypothetical protein
MRTPFGQECRYYYQDFHRNRSLQECRLIAQSPTAQEWTPDLCRECPAPGMLRANGCQHLRLEGRVARGFLGIGRRVEVAAACVRSGGKVEQPHVGCGQCHLDTPIAALFSEE